MKALPEYPLTFVMAEESDHIHLFIHDSIQIELVKRIMDHFSRVIEQPVQAFHDERTERYRLSPLNTGILLENKNHGRFIFESGGSERFTTHTRSEEVETTIYSETSQSVRIPRPPNRWILYRQAKASEILRRHQNVTAAEISTIVSEMWKNEPPSVIAQWQLKANDEDRKHKLAYPNYKWNSPRRKIK
ncbi:hypothetical protein BGZ63DRAFT_451620 [Mariannaea sp. PMI_226]|nr:hypothetical protein BGZ63DRAFT_451620 [Mariannaea sp. PMI_226]